MATLIETEALLYLRIWSDHIFSSIQHLAGSIQPHQMSSSSLASAASAGRVAASPSMRCLMRARRATSVVFCVFSSSRRCTTVVPFEGSCRRLIRGQVRRVGSMPACPNQPPISPQRPAPNWQQQQLLHPSTHPQLGLQLGI